MCSRKIKKLCNINFSNKEYINLLPLVNLYGFCLQKIVACDFDLLRHLEKLSGCFYTKVFDFKTIKYVSVSKIRS